MTLRYALIGAGMMGHEHMRNLALLEGVEVTAFSDPNPAMRATAGALVPGARAFTDYKQMLSADIADVYLIVSPNDMHSAHLRDVMATGKPILVEKPLATTTAECRELLTLAQGRAAPVWVTMEYRYMPPLQRLLASVVDGVAGTPRMISIREHRFPFLPKVDDWNRFNRRTGGTLVEKCCHFWDLMRLTLQSNPVRVYASAGVDVNHLDEVYDGQTPDIIDNAFVVVDFDNGARGMLDLCMFAEGSYWQERIAVTGEKARLEALIPGPARFSPDGSERAAEFVISPRATKQEQREVVPVPEHILAAGDHHGSTYFQHERFRDLVLAGVGKSEVTVEDGYWSVLVGEAAEQSARTGMAVDLRGKGP